MNLLLDGCVGARFFSSVMVLSLLLGAGAANAQDAKLKETKAAEAKGQAAQVEEKAVEEVATNAVAVAPAVRVEGLRIKNVSVAPRDEKTATVKFDIVWPNSWRHGVFHDAAWVFFKVRPNETSAWQHVRLAADKVLNPAGYGQKKEGTASVFAATTAEFRADIRRGVLSCGRAATPGLWHPYAYINGGGMNLEWFRREFGNGLDFDALNRLAGKIVPSLEDPLFIPHLAGRVSPGWPHLRGAWAGLTWAHATGHLYRAMLEGVALEYRLYKEALMALYPRLKVRELRITGGGGKSAVWNAIKADALNCRVVQIAASEGAPMGAALLAGFGVGLLEDLNQAASKWIGTGNATSPNRRLARLYEARYRRYVDLLNKMNEWSET